eukprot:TRINITY_DN1964_c0_g1_i2.p2 TRINITY_DN1964_c0_g1~~TRINITY_DN1964_c0_g1_i2.p2  ORF type:complete len:261 (-),score=54.43 TRINITY_DN1964_c0_g1_i2:1432-2148(-)
MATETKKKIKWLPVTSSPEIMNKGMQGINPSDLPMYQYTDVFGLDDELLMMVPQPVIAVTLLFPLTENYNKAKAEEEETIKARGQVISPNVYFMRQKVGNACGTIAMFHALLNNRDKVGVAGALAKFYENTKDMDFEQRAIALGEDEVIAATHHEAAVTGTDETTNWEAVVDNHFIAFVMVDGSLYELDGRKPWPINHGKTTPESFLFDTAQIIRKFMARDPTNLNFNIMALAANQDL